MLPGLRPHNPHCFSRASTYDAGGEESFRDADNNLAKFDAKGARGGGGGGGAGAAAGPAATAAERCVCRVSMCVCRCFCPLRPH